jgi:beta-lactamase class A
MLKYIRFSEGKRKVKNFLIILFFVGLVFGSVFTSIAYMNAKYEVENAIIVFDEENIDYSDLNHMGIFERRKEMREIYIDYLNESNPYTDQDIEGMSKDQLEKYNEFSGLYTSYVDDFNVTHDYGKTNANINFLNEFSSKVVELERYFSDLEGVEVAVSLDSNGLHYGYNEDYEMAAASTIKVLVSLAVIDAINTGEVSPDDFVEYDMKEHYESGAGYYQTVDNFKGATVWELVEKMIVYSDNIAWKMLYDVVSKEEVFSYYTQLTGKKMNYTDTAYMTTSDTNIILNELYIHKDEAYYNDVFNWMAETEDQTRIYAASEYEVHHKIGDLYVGKILYTHDTAIVMAPIPYTISIMVEGVDYETNEQIIEDVIYIIEG